MIKEDIPKYKCSVYNDPEKRFSADGCWNSYEVGIDYDPFPGDLLTMHIGTKKSQYLFWNPGVCEDGKMRPLGIDECTYEWNKDKFIYEGECTQCGKCCLGCKFLVDENDEQVGDDYIWV